MDSIFSSRAALTALSTLTLGMQPSGVYADEHEIPQIYEQDNGLSVHYKVTGTSTPLLYQSEYSWLHDLYNTRNKRELQDFLDQNVDLIEFIKLAFYEIRSLVPVNAIEIGVYSDVEEGWKKIFFDIDYKANDLDVAMEYEELLLNEWLIPNEYMTQGRVFLTHS